MNKELRAAFKAAVAMSALALNACTGLYENFPDRADSSASIPIKVTPMTAALVTEQMRTHAAATQRGEGPAPAGFSSDPHDYRYLVGAGDRLEITVPALTTLAAQPAAPSGASGALNDTGPAGNLYIVAEDGQIFLPYVGFIPVAGKPIQEIQRQVTAELSKFIRAPQVLVSVHDFNSRRVLVAGAVPKPGYLPLSNLPMSVLDALTVVGAINPTPRIESYPTLITNTAQQNNSVDQPDLSHVELRRSGGGAAVVNAERMLLTGDLSQNWVLHEGDILRVAPITKTFVYLMGEVRQQALVEIRNDQTSLAQVINVAGGFDQNTANARRLYVIRGGLNEPSVFQLNAESTDALIVADAFRLQSRDIVYVAEANISRWNRFLNGLVPSLQTILNAGVLLKLSEQP